MSFSFGRLALPCALGGLGATAAFLVAEAGIGSMPFGVLVVAEAMVGQRKISRGPLRDSRDLGLQDTLQTA